MPSADPAIDNVRKQDHFFDPSTLKLDMLERLTGGKLPTWMQHAFTIATLPDEVANDAAGTLARGMTLDYSTTAPKARSMRSYTDPITGALRPSYTTVTKQMSPYMERMMLYSVMSEPGVHADTAEGIYKVIKRSGVDLESLDWHTMLGIVSAHASETLPDGTPNPSFLPHKQLGRFWINLDALKPLDLPGGTMTQIRLAAESAANGVYLQGAGEQIDSPDMPLPLAIADNPPIPIFGQAFHPFIDDFYKSQGVYDAFGPDPTLMPASVYATSRLTVPNHRDEAVKQMYQTLEKAQTDRAKFQTDWSNIQPGDPLYHAKQYAQKQFTDSPTYKLASRIIDGDPVQLYKDHTNRLIQKIQYEQATKGWFDRNIWSKALHGYDVASRFVKAVAWEGANIPDEILNRINPYTYLSDDYGKAVQANREKVADQSYALWQGTTSYQDIFQSMGYPEWAAQTAGLVADWYTDPLIIAGGGFRLFRMAHGATTADRSIQLGTKFAGHMIRRAVEGGGEVVMRDGMLATNPSFSDSFPTLSRWLDEFNPATATNMKRKVGTWVERMHPYWWKLAERTSIPVEAKKAQEIQTAMKVRYRLQGQRQAVRGFFASNPEVDSDTLTQLYLQNKNDPDIPKTVRKYMDELLATHKDLLASEAHLTSGAYLTPEDEVAFLREHLADIRSGNLPNWVSPQRAVAYGRSRRTLDEAVKNDSLGAAEDLQASATLDEIQASEKLPLDEITPEMLDKAQETVDLLTRGRGPHHWYNGIDRIRVHYSQRALPPLVSEYMRKLYVSAIEHGTPMESLKPAIEEIIQAAAGNTSRNQLSSIAGLIDALELGQTDMETLTKIVTGEASGARAARMAALDLSRAYSDKAIMTLFQSDPSLSAAGLIQKWRDGDLYPELQRTIDEMVGQRTADLRGIYGTAPAREDVIAWVQGDLEELRVGNYKPRIHMLSSEDNSMMGNSRDAVGAVAQDPDKVIGQLATRVRKYAAEANYYRGTQRVRQQWDQAPEWGQYIKDTMAKVEELDPGMFGFPGQGLDSAGAFEYAAEKYFAEQEVIWANAMNALEFGDSRYYVTYLGHRPLMGSQKITDLLFNNTAFGKGWKAVRNRVPNLTPNIESELPQWVEWFSTRGRTYSREQIGNFMRKAYQVSDPNYGPKRVEHFIDLLEQIQRGQWQHYGKIYGVPAADVEGIMLDHRRAILNQAAQLFGITHEGELTSARQLIEDIRDQAKFQRKPLDITQLVNTWPVSDPLMVKRLVADYVGVKNRFTQLARRTLGLTVKQIERRGGPGGLNIWEHTRNAMINGGDFYLKYWKPLVVISPRYAFRVPLFDEQIRFFLSMGPLERMRQSAVGRATIGRLEKAKTFTHIIGPEDTHAIYQELQRAGFGQTGEDPWLEAQRAAKLAVQERIDGIAGFKDPLDAGMSAQYSTLSRYARDVIETSTMSTETPNILHGVVLGDDTWGVTFNPKQWLKRYQNVGARDVEERAAGGSPGTSKIYVQDDKNAAIQDQIRITFNANRQYTIGDHMRELAMKRLTARMAQLGTYKSTEIHELGHTIMMDMIRRGDVTVTDDVAGSLNRLTAKAPKPGQPALPGMAKATTDEAQKARDVMTDLLGAFQHDGYITYAGGDGPHVDSFWESFSEAWRLYHTDEAAFKEIWPEWHRVISDNKKYLTEIEKTYKDAGIIERVPARSAGNRVRQTISVSRRDVPKVLDASIYTSEASQHAEMAMTWKEAAANMERDARTTDADGKTIWSAITPVTGEKQVNRRYMGHWIWALKRQFGQGPLSRVVLSTIEKGGDQQQAIKDLTDFAEGGGRYVQDAFAQLGATDSVLREQKIEDLVKNIYQMTMNGRADIADAIMNRSVNDLKRILETIPPTERPAIQALDVIRSTGKGNPLDAGLNRMARFIMQDMTNFVSRQPFAKAHYKFMKEWLLGLAEANKLPMSRNDFDRIEKAATQYAVDRTNSIMFNFRTQSRFGEMMRFVFPFFQPFAEQFVVYGKLLRENPGAFAFANRVIQEVNKDLFQVDPQTGDRVVPMDWFMNSVMQLSLVGGMGTPQGMFGAGPDDAGPWSLTGSIQSLNFMFSNMFDFPLPGGGQLPIPFPSMNVPVIALLQKVFDWSGLDEPSAPGSYGQRLKNSIFDQLYAYGDVTKGGVGHLVPRWISYMFPPKEITDSETIKALKLMEIQGITPQFLADKKGISIQAAKRLQLKMATDNMEKVNVWMSVASMFSPVSVRLHWPQENLEIAHRQLISKYGWEIGTDKFNEQYPGYEAITIPASFAAGNKMSIPANQIAERLLQTPYIAKVAHMFPDLAAMLIPHELWDQPFDRASMLRQFEEGLRKNKTPLQWVNDLETTKFYDAWRLLRDKWDRRQDQLLGDGLTADDGKYRSRYQQFKDDEAALGQIYPAAYKAFKTQTNMGADPKVEEMLRTAAKNQVFLGTEAGQFLDWYWKHRDPVFQHMVDHNMTSLYNPSSLSLRDKWETALDAAFKKWPDGERLYNLMLSNDMYADMDTHRTELDRELAQDPRAMRETGNWESDWNHALLAVDHAADPVEVDQAYLNLRSLAMQSENGEWSFRLTPLQYWWQTQTDSQQKFYKEGLQNRPMVFWSQFDREVMKIPTSQQAEKYWYQVNLDTTAIDKYRAEHVGEPNQPNLYVARDSYVAEWAAKDKTFAKQVQYANIWGYALEHSSLTTADTNAAKAWQYVFDYTHQLQAELNRVHSTGERDPNAQHKALWQASRNALEHYLKEAAGQNALFNVQLQNLEESNGSTPLAYQLIPDSYFPLGGFDLAQEGLP